MAAKNIWIDDAFPYSGQTLHYCVKRNGIKIYEGEATARDFPIVIYLNRIAQDYLESSFPKELGVNSDPGACAAFSLVEMAFNGYEWVESNNLYCVNYIDAWGGKNGQEMAQTINGHADPRQKLLYTSYGEIYGCGTVDSGVSDNTYIDTVEYSGDTASKISFSGFVSSSDPYSSHHSADNFVEAGIAGKDDFSAVTVDGLRLIYPSNAYGNISDMHYANDPYPYVSYYTVYYVFDEPVRFNDGDLTPMGAGHIVIN